MAADEPTKDVRYMRVLADSIAAEWAQLNQQALVSFPAEWDVYGKSAGPVRNRQMLEEGKPDFVWAFKTHVQSRGTNHMVNIARKAGLPVYVVEGGG